MDNVNHLYQYSLLNALMEGVCEAGIPVSKLLSKGNQGVGTFARMNGELVLLDDKVYQLQAGGIREASMDDQIPYAVATHFSPTHTQEHQRLQSKQSIDQILTSVAPQAANLFVSYRIRGRFVSVTARTIRGQQYRGQPLSELGDNQSVNHYKDIEGTIVGFRTPAAWQGFSVAGHHLHFISSDCTRGGHVLDVSAEDASVGMAVAANVHIELPTSEEFSQAKLRVDDSGIKKVEG
ncbi:alpha-acetolactate decarboxylase [Helicocarpus griseus UAMH5409]|uniref:Alpha-acetolactate decarboxylase n=1 Tax=Helicocarpus griseus UAMH5409 TaxID=1447875 RepID=A0A2B7XVI7_9EURO|nr:alpha-acetolactate decarboxylase [Helicocarpus griseus UAMH5409]